jgi:hypothetical protein
MTLRAIAVIASWLSLAGTIVPPVLFMIDRVTLDQMKLWMLAATVVWFATAPLWMDRGLLRHDPLGSSQRQR